MEAGMVIVEVSSMEKERLWVATDFKMVLGVLEGELFAIYLALQKARERRIAKIQVQSDSKVAVLALNRSCLSLTIVTIFFLFFDRSDSASAGVALPESHKEAAPFKIKSFPWYDDLCAVFGKDRATGKHAETVTDVVEELEAEKENTTLGEDDFSNANNVDEVESMSVSDATRGAQSHTQSDGSSKKKRKAANHEELSNALTQSASILAEVIEKASIRLSKAIGEDLNEKHMQLGKELERTTTLTTTQRHKVARMIMQDNALVSYFFSVPDDEKDEWARLLIDGSL
ncbi:uncharacterized protein LOC133039682 [Cannabis sativa]|uniref:uncharacterized protein LOC133039682 n=1 Tax=Cannabis sativa TaxID=3483 RepID=UPI0029CA758B|nr:uncharacterized protein LOC133039682 [Cannabis sativa]